MLEGVGGRHLRELFQRPVAKRPARSGEHEAAHVGGAVAFEALEDRVVLAVHRQQPAAAGPGRRHHQLAGKHQDFLRGEGDGLFRRDGGEGRLECRGANDGHEDDIGLGQGGEFAQAASAAIESGASRESGAAPGGGQGGRVREADLPHPELSGNFGQPLMFAMGGDAHELQPVTLGGENPQGALPDRAGGPEENDTFFLRGIWHARWNSLHTPARCATPL